jgi:ClpP class serine protease
MPKVTEDMMTGRVYMARDVMGKMVDEIGTLDSAIKKAADMSKKRTIANKPNNQIK